MMRPTNHRTHRSYGRAGAPHLKKPAPPQEADPFDGVLIVDKPSGMTSHDVVDRIRRTFGFAKVGHGGTLDPMATGVLILLIGRGTKLSDLFIGSDKTYEGTMRLGTATDSHDADGKVVSEGDFSRVTRNDVAADMLALTGDIMQTPPMVSAVKVDGVPLYKRARKGQEVKRAARLIHVYEFTLLGFDLPDAVFRLRCTKGTYVRSLCAEIGEHLKCGAHLARLRRTTCGEMRIEEAVPLEELLHLDRDRLRPLIKPVHKFSAYSLSRPVGE